MAALSLAMFANLARASVDSGMCPLAGCGGTGEHSAAVAAALMQHVQPQHPDYISKVVAKEAAPALPSGDAVGKTHTSAQSAVVVEDPAQLDEKPADPPAHTNEVLALQRTPGRMLPKQGGSTGNPTSQVATISLKAQEAAASKVSHGHQMFLSMLQTSSQHKGMARLAAQTAPRVHTHLRGWTAPLDEAGYAAVASLKADDDMEMFVRRVVDAYDCKIVNQTGFMGIVPWFSGVTKTQSFQKLQETLLYAVLAKTGTPWVRYKNTDGTDGNSADLSFMGYVEVAATRKDAELLKFTRRLCTKLGVKIVDEKGFQAMLRLYTSTPEKFQDFSKLELEIHDAAKARDSWAIWENPQAPLSKL